jgi:glucan-binding repeat-containing protein
MSRNFKKIAVASALVAATTLPTTMVSALETNVKNDSNTPVTLSSERRGWYEEYGYKYYYDDNGELLKGLQEIDGNTYYFYSYDGHMAYSSWYDEDTITDNGLIVTVDKSGIVTNHANIVAGDWTHYGDRWYYYDADMNPYIGVKTINGVKYYFEWEGRLATRTYEGIWVITFDRQLIAYNQNGVVTDQQDIVGNKWIKVNNKWYYFDKNLNPYQGVQKVDGVEYFFWSDGQLATYDYDGISTATSNNYLVSYNKNGIVIEKVKIEGNKWIKFNNNWYYYDQDLYPYQGIHTIGDATYYFLSNGQLATSGFEGNITTVREGNKYYAYDYTGKVVEQVDIVGNKWIEFNGGKYYFDSELTPYSGIQTIDGVEYYFNYGQLAEYLDEVVTSGDTLAYVRDGKVIEKAKFKDNELIYLNGNCYYYYLNDAGYYYPYDGEYTVDGKSLYFIYGMLQTSDSDEILTDYRNDYLYAYNNKGEIVDKVKRVAGWNEIGNDWYYVSSEMNFVDGIYTVNGKEYYFENGRLIKSSNGISVVSSYRDENDKIVTYVIAYNSEGVVVEKKKAVANTWIQLRGKWYYYDKNLNEVEGIETINGVKYIFSWGELLTASGNNIEVTTAYEKGKMLLVAYDKNGIVKETTVLTSRKLTEFIGNKYLYDRYYEPCTGWQEVDGTKYHFDADGKMTTGWLEEEKTWYYLDKDGQKTTGWLTLSGKKYYFDKEGKMVTGTVNVDGKDYTFNENGELNVETPEVKSGWVQSGNKWYYYDNNQKVTGYQTIEGKKYYFDANGVMQTGWFKIDNADYYATSSGAINAQWVGSGNNWYYVDADGKMVTGFQTIAGAKYYFASSGLMQTGWFKIDNTDYYAASSGAINAQWVGSGNNWYYVDADGKMVTGFQTIAGAKYYFASSGLMQKGWFKINGADYYATSSGAIEAQWVGSGNTWYYVDADGKMVTGYQTVAGAKYYFAESGLMQTGWFKINGEDYYAASSGVISAQWVKSGNNWYYVDANGKMVTGDYKINGVVNRFDINGVWLR